MLGSRATARWRVPRLDASFRGRLYLWGDSRPQRLLFRSSSRQPACAPWIWGVLVVWMQYLHAAGGKPQPTWFLSANQNEQGCQYREYAPGILPCWAHHLKMHAIASWRVPTPSRACTPPTCPTHQTRSLGHFYLMKRLFGYLQAVAPSCDLLQHFLYQASNRDSGEHHGEIRMGFQSRLEDHFRDRFVLRLFARNNHNRD
jgi:hypothetical protein